MWVVCQGFLVREACVGVLVGGAVFLLFVQSRSDPLVTLPLLNSVSYSEEIGPCKLHLLASGRVPVEIAAVKGLGPSVTLVHQN